MKGIMILSGALTFTMIFAAISPQAALDSMFGKNITGPLAEIIVRNWGALIALVGRMLVYGAFNIAVRQLVLVVAILSKLTFITLVTINGFAQQLTLPITFDSIIVLIFVIYLYSNKHE